MPKRKQSDVWNYFSKCNKDEAKCNKCEKVLKCTGGSTSSLNYHLETSHAETTNEMNQGDKKKTKERRIEEDVTKLASADGISFNAIGRRFMSLKSSF